MPEEVKTITESSANSTCACFGKKKRKRKQAPSNSLRVEMKEECSIENDCSVCKTANIKHGKGPKGNKKSFFWSHVCSRIPAPLKLQEKRPGSFCVISLSCFHFLAIYSVDLFSQTLLSRWLKLHLIAVWKNKTLLCGKAQRKLFKKTHFFGFHFIWNQRTR